MRSDQLPTVAAITMVRDEGVMLPRWVAHYSRELGADHLVVVDDNSEDGSTDHLPCPVIRMPPITREFEASRMGILSDLAAMLLNAYDAVIFTDADEFLVADPDRFASLRHFAARRRKDVVGAVGLNVVQLGDEGPLDPGRPVLDQRAAAKFLPLMCKPALKRVPARWRWASHGIMAPYTVDPELFMFHLKFADRGLLFEQGEHRRRMVETDGRAATTSWRLGGHEMMTLMDHIAEQGRATALEPFVARPRTLKQVVENRPDGSYRAVGAGQMQAMERRPLVGIPERFCGRV